MRTWSRFGIMVLGLSLAVMLTAGPANGKDKDSVRRITTKAQKSVTKAPAAKQDPKVDTFIDENNDGVDDRRARKVVRPEPRKPARTPAPEATKSKEKPAEKPKTESKPPR